MPISIKKALLIQVFSPVTFAELTLSEIYNISAKDNVVYIGYDSSKEAVDLLGYATTAVQVDYTRDTLGFDGYGIKVGMCESGSPKAHSELNSIQITNISGNSYVTDHATYVARVIMGTNGVAPNASLYTANFAYGNIPDQIEGLVSVGVSVINYSAATDREDGIYYDDWEMWIDHIVSQHNISFVVAAGNNGVTSAVTSPGLAYNAITVGGTDTKSTSSRDDDSIYNESDDEGSCSGNGGTAGCAKPDLLAPAVMWGNIRGTSLSTPVVTGIIAQMMEYKPTLMDKPELVKAILTASTDKKVLPGASPAVSENWAGTITAQQGAGQVNAKRAISILGKGRYAYGTMSSGTVSKTFTVSSSDSWIRYCVAWTRNSSIYATDHTESYATVGASANLKLQVYNSSGTSMGSSNITTSSVELVHFTVGSTGTHTAKITRMDSATNPIEYAVAWY